jgi:hypothetical protein
MRILTFTNLGYSQWVWVPPPLAHIPLVKQSLFTLFSGCGELCFKKRIAKNCAHPCNQYVYMICAIWVSRAAERGGGQGGKLPGPRGAPEIFLLGPSLFCVLNISAQRTRYLVFLAKYRNLAWKIEKKSLESNCNVLVRKNFWPKKLLT